MRRVFKYPLPEPDTTIALADTDTVLSVAMQADQIVLWAIRDLDRDPIERRFICVNTGAEPPQFFRSFVGTVRSTNGIVWHVFEVFTTEGVFGHPKHSATEEGRS